MRRNGGTLLRLDLGSKSLREALRRLKWLLWLILLKLLESLARLLVKLLSTCWI